MARRRAMAAEAARKNARMHHSSMTKVRSAAEAATASHRQKEDGGTVDTVGAATDQAFGEDRQSNMKSSRAGDGAA